MPSTLLLSFRAEDRAVAERLARRLFAAGVEPRLDGWLLAPGPTGEVAAARLRAVDDVCALLGAAGALTDDPTERAFVRAHPRVFAVFGPGADLDRCPADLGSAIARVDWRDEGDAGVAALVRALRSADEPDVSLVSTHGAAEETASAREPDAPAPIAPDARDVEADPTQRWRALAWIAAATAAVSGLLTVSALITANGALQARDALADARRSDDARRITDLAVASREDDPGLSLALAELAMRVEPSEAARSALIAALHVPAVVAARQLPRGEVHAGWAPDGRELTIINGTLPRVWPSDGGTPTALRGHTGLVTSVAWAPDGRVALGSFEGRAWVWGADGHLQQALTGHVGEVHRMAFGPAGLLLTVAEDPAARIWTPDSATPIARLPHVDTILGGAWSPDGRVLTVSADRTARVWSSSGAPLAVLAGHDTAVTTGLWLSDGNILTLTHGGVATRWSADGTELTRGTSLATQIDAAAAGPDGMVVEDAGSYAVIVSRPSPPRWEVLQIRNQNVAVERSVWSDQGQLLVRQTDGRATVWEPHGDTLTLKHTIDLRGDRIVDAAWAPRGQVYTASASGLALTWDLTAPFHRTVAPPAQRLIGGSYAPDGRLIAATDDHAAVVWPAGDGPPVVLTGHASSIASVGWGPNGRVFATGMDDTVRVWGPDGTALAAGNFSGASWQGKHLTWTGEDRLFIPVDFGGAHLWDIRSNTIANIGGSTDFVHARFVHATGRVLTVDDQGVVALWDRAGSVSARLLTPIPDVQAVDIDPHGRALMTTATGAVFVWRPDAAEATELRGVGATIRHARWGPDGRVYGSTDAFDLYAWTTPDATPERIPMPEPFPDGDSWMGPVIAATSDPGHLRFEPPALGYAATFGADAATAPDDAWMALLHDGVMFVYTKGERYATLRPPNGAMALLAVGPKGRVLTASGDGVAQDWHLDDDSLLALARSRTLQGFSAAQVEALRLGPLLERRARPLAR